MKRNSPNWVNISDGESFGAGRVEDLPRAVVDPRLGCTPRPWHWCFKDEEFYLARSTHYLAVYRLWGAQWQDWQDGTKKQSRPTGGYAYNEGMWVSPEKPSPNSGSRLANPHEFDQATKVWLRWDAPFFVGKAESLHSRDYGLRGGGIQIWLPNTTIRPLLDTRSCNEQRAEAASSVVTGLTA